jgi:hypothetical protein
MTDKYDINLRDAFEGETISFLEALEMARVHERKNGMRKMRKSINEVIHSPEQKKLDKQIVRYLGWKVK